MDIRDLVEEAGYQPKRKAACNGGEYSSPCPFCKDGDDRFLIWPKRSNNNGEFNGGRFSCRICEESGDAINFLRLLYGMSYVEACEQLRIEPKKRSNLRTSELPKLRTAQDPPENWKEKATVFSEWANTRLNNYPEGLALLHDRGFSAESISKFCLGYNPRTLFRERPDWGLTNEVKENGKPRMVWLPAGLVIPTLSKDQIVKVKIRRSEWREDDQWPKYVEVSGSKQTPSVFGDTSLPCMVLESELDALLIQQEAADLVYCVALGGSTKPLDLETDHLLRKSSKILFLPDFDEAGAVAWSKWKNKFSNIQRILTPYEKSAGDYLKAGGDLREWIESELNGG